MNVLIFGATRMVGQGVLRECPRARELAMVQTGGRQIRILSIETIGQAMLLAAARRGAPKAALEVGDIARLAQSGTTR